MAIGDVSLGVGHHVASGKPLQEVLEGLDRLCVLLVSELQPGQPKKRIVGISLLVLGIKVHHFVVVLCRFVVHAPPLVLLCQAKGQFGIRLGLESLLNILQGILALQVVFDGGDELVRRCIPVYAVDLLASAVHEYHRGKTGDLVFLPGHRILLRLGLYENHTPCQLNNTPMSEG